MEEADEEDGRREEEKKKEWIAHLNTGTPHLGCGEARGRLRDSTS